MKLMKKLLGETKDEIFVKTKSSKRHFNQSLEYFQALVF